MNSDPSFQKQPWPRPELRATKILKISVVAITMAPSIAAHSQPAFYEVSSILGADNLARTTDAHVADINNDRLMDIFEGNSNTSRHRTDVVIRFGNGAGFSTVRVGPRDDVVSHDVDLIDLNNDDFPDLIRTEVIGSLRRISIYRNRRGSGGLWFDLAAPDFYDVLTYCPHDIAVGDLNRDGRLDFAVTERVFGDCLGGGPGADISVTNVYLGKSRAFSFSRIARLRASPSTTSDQSTNDVFFIDGDADGDLDIFTVNEAGVPGRLWRNSGGSRPTFVRSSQSFPTALAGEAADFNGDDRSDFVLGGVNRVTVHIQGSAGSFATRSLSNASAGSFLDMELGDLDRDGDVDITAIGVTRTGAGFVRMWLNDGSGAFIPWNDSTPLPGHRSDQRLSVDLIDFDKDGDLDVYVGGGDRQANRGCTGCVPNQLFEGDFRTGPADFNGDGSADPVLIRSVGNDLEWMADFNRNGSPSFRVRYGLATDRPIPGDYNGDGRTDFAVLRKVGNDYQWIIDVNHDGVTDIRKTYGILGDRAVPADYNGDGRTDFAMVRRESGLRWYIDWTQDGRSDRRVTYGIKGDRPVPADYNGDGRADLAVLRTSSNIRWFVDTNLNGVTNLRMDYGLPTDIPVPQDFNGDGATDFAVVRKLSGGLQWIVDWNRDGVTDFRRNLGLLSSQPVPADYDGDGRADLATIRPARFVNIRFHRWNFDFDRDGRVDAQPLFGRATDRHVPANF